MRTLTIQAGRRMLIRLLLLATTVAVGAGALPSTVAAQPPTAELPYTSTGTIDYIDNASNVVVISDREYRLPLNATIRSGKSVLSRNALSKGMSVGFNAANETVLEIWVLTGR